MNFMISTPGPEALSPLNRVTKDGRENLIDLNVKDLRENFDRIPKHVKYQRKLIQEIETMHFSLFLGLSNLELLQDEDK